MKIAVKTNQPERKLVAVVNTNNNGLWVGNIYINNNGDTLTSVYNSLEEAYDHNDDRIPIYEGDSITITF